MLSLCARVPRIAAAFQWFVPSPGEYLIVFAQGFEVSTMNLLSRTDA